MSDKLNALQQAPDHSLQQPGRRQREQGGEQGRGLVAQVVRRQVAARAADRKGIAKAERQYQFPTILRSGINAKGKQIHYLFNYSYEPVTISYPYADSRSLLDSQKLKTSAPVTIEPWGVVIGEEI